MLKKLKDTSFPIMRHTSQNIPKTSRNVSGPINCLSYRVITSCVLQYGEDVILSSFFIEFVSGYLSVRIPPISLEPPPSLSMFRPIASTQPTETKHKQP